MMMRGDWREAGTRYISDRRQGRGATESDGVVMVDTKRASIVVADGDLAARDELGESLASLGYHVTFGAGYRELLGILRQVGDAVLFIDAGFEGQDALEHLQGLLYQAHCDHRRLVIIVGSAVSDSKLALAAARAGAFRYIAKPVRPSLLGLIVQDALAELTKEEPDDEKAVAAAQDHLVAERHPIDAQALGALDDSDLDEAHAAVAEHVEETGLDADPLAGVTAASVASEEEQGAWGRRFPMERMSVLNNAPEEPGVITFYDADDRPLFVEWASSLVTRLSYYVDLHPGLSPIARSATSFDVFPTMDQEQVAKIFDRLVNKFGCFPTLMSEAPEGATHQMPRAPEARAPQARAPEAPALSSSPSSSSSLSSFAASQQVAEREKAAMEAEAKALSAPSLPRTEPGVPVTLGLPRGDEPSGGRGADHRVTQYNASPDTRMLDGIRQLLAKNPSDPDTQDWLAFTLYSNNLLDEAVLWYTRLITNGSRKEEHFFYCANALFKRGDVDRAVKLWRVASKLKPTSAIAKKSAARIAEVQRPR